MACWATAVPDRRRLVRLPCPWPYLRLARCCCRDESGLPAPFVPEFASSHTHAPQFSVSAPQAGPSRSVPQPVVAVGERRPAGWVWSSHHLGRKLAHALPVRLESKCAESSTQHPALHVSGQARRVQGHHDERGAVQHDLEHIPAPRPTSLLRSQTRIHARDSRWTSSPFCCCCLSHPHSAPARPTTPLCPTVATCPRRRYLIR